jgi:hypothetical protein
MSYFIPSTETAPNFEDCILILVCWQNVVPCTAKLIADSADVAFRLSPLFRWVTLDSSPLTSLFHLFKFRMLVTLTTRMCSHVLEMMHTQSGALVYSAPTWKSITPNPKS